MTVQDNAYINYKLLNSFYGFKMDTNGLPEIYACSPCAAPLDFEHKLQANYKCPCYSYYKCNVALACKVPSD